LDQVLPGRARHHRGIKFGDLGKRAHAIQRVRVATWIEAGLRELAGPSVKHRLAALRHLFDLLVLVNS
jgi:hypothetical protein